MESVIDLEKEPTPAEKKREDTPPAVTDPKGKSVAETTEKPPVKTDDPEKPGPSIALEDDSESDNDFEEKETEEQRKERLAAEDFL